MKYEENTSSAIKASDPLTPKQDNRIFESIPVRPAPWNKQSEAGSPMSRERALNMFRTSNQWLYDKLAQDATCQCGNCYLCAYNFFAAPVAPPSTLAAIRAVAEEWFRVAQESEFADDAEMIAALSALLSRFFGKGETGRVVNVNAHGEPTRNRLREIEASVANGYETQYRELGWSTALQASLRDLHFLLTFFKTDTIAAPASPSPAEPLPKSQLAVARKIVLYMNQKSGHAEGDEWFGENDAKAIAAIVSKGAG